MTSVAQAGKARKRWLFVIGTVSVGALLWLGAKVSAGGSRSDPNGSMLIVSSNNLTEPGEALKQCDTLAAHPADPQRYAVGISDDQIIPGLAIEACEAATRLNQDKARAWFELGRAYWSGHRDSAAFNSFVEATRRGYLPAKKYIGDAYLEGRGLPPGQYRDAMTALRWYKESAESGFAEAQTAVDLIEGRIKKRLAEAERAKFDPSAFQNPKFISQIYYKTFEDIDTPEFFFYASSFVEELGGDKILFVKSECKPLISSRLSYRLSLLANDFAANNSMDLAGQQFGYALDLMLKDERNMSKVINPNNNPVIKQLQQLSVYADQGDRDAVALVNRYKCDSDVARTLTKNLLNEYDHTE